MSLQRLPPNRSMERAEVSPDALVPAEPSYSRRVFTDAVTNAKEHLGVKTIASTLAALFVAWLKTGSFWVNGAWTVGAFVVFMLLATLFEVLLAPRRLDKARQDEIAGLNNQIGLLHEDVALLQAEIAEIRRIKLTFEVLTQIWNSKVCLSDPGDTEDYRDATTFFLTAQLWLRFYNDDSEAVRLHDISLSIVTTSGSEQPLSTHITPVNVHEPDAEGNTYFVPFVISGKDQTKPYFFRFFVDVPRECALAVDKDSFLRVTIDAGEQDTYFVDLTVPWRAAREGDTDVSLRP